ncbi:MAG: hypothetical protein ACRDTT_05950 [Pseudonocardiaceae bacterium]
MTPRTWLPAGDEDAQDIAALAGEESRDERQAPAAAQSGGRSYEVEGL